jgi:hypothetical protein
MERKLFKAIIVFWLVIILPILGILPLLMLTETIEDSGGGSSGGWAVVILRSARGIIFSDPAPGSSHVHFNDLGPDSAWWLTVSIVFAISFALLFCLHRTTPRSNDQLR